MRGALRAAICYLDNTGPRAARAAASSHVVELRFSGGLCRCFFAKKIRPMTFCRSVLRGAGVDVVEW
jgi:hypothetical protein